MSSVLHRIEFTVGYDKAAASGLDQLKAKNPAVWEEVRMEIKNQVYATFAGVCDYVDRSTGDDGAHHPFKQIFEDLRRRISASHELTEKDTDKAVSAWTKRVAGESTNPDAKKLSVGAAIDNGKCTLVKDPETGEWVWVNSRTYPLLAGFNAFKIAAHDCGKTVAFEAPLQVELRWLCDQQPSTAGSITKATPLWARAALKKHEDRTGPHAKNRNATAKGHGSTGHSAHGETS